MYKFIHKNREYSIVFQHVKQTVKHPKGTSDAQATTAVLKGGPIGGLDKEKEVVATGTVVRHYKDNNNRRKANEYAVRSLINNSPVELKPFIWTTHVNRAQAKVLSFDEKGQLQHS